MSEIKPITPKEASKSLHTKIEPEMIQAFNELITENLSSGSARFTQDEVQKRYLKIKGLTGAAAQKEMRRVYDNHLMDAEPLFRKAGWSVYFDKPGYNESYDASFKFSIK